MDSSDLPRTTTVDSNSESDSGESVIEVKFEDANSEVLEISDSDLESGDQVLGTEMSLKVNPPLLQNCSNYAAYIKGSCLDGEG